MTRALPAFLSSHWAQVAPHNRFLFLKVEFNLVFCKDKQSI